MSEPEFEPDMTEAEVAAIDREDSDEPDPDNSDQDEPEALHVDEPPELDSGAAMEAIGKKLDLLSKHVAKRITEILGEAAPEWEECELCNYWNTPGWRHKGPLPEAVEDALNVALGKHAQTEYKSDEYSRVCEKCNGLGEVLTGSRVNGQLALPCMACKGMGWVPVGNERATGAFAHANGPAPGQTAPSPTPQPPAPESPEITAAKALLTGAGWMAFPPINATA